MIFIANSPIDLLDLSVAKQYEGFSKQDFVAWKQKRSETIALEPLKPHEPIAFFDFGEQEQISVDIQFRC